MSQMENALSKSKLTKGAEKALIHRKLAHLAGKKTGGGVVRYCVHGPSGKLLDSDYTPAKIINVLRVGLPFKELQELQACLAVPTDNLAPLLGISKATFHRRKGTDTNLNPSVSDRVVRFAKLLGKAVKVFGNLDDASQWLGSPQFGLGGAVPLDYAKSELGAREVENLLGRIEYGVYT